MRKILFVFSLLIGLSLMAACSDDDNSDPKLSFGRSIYILKAAESTGRGINGFGTGDGRSESSFLDRRYCRVG